MHEGVSFASFAQGKDAKSNHKRYLIAAAWLYAESLFIFQCCQEARAQHACRLGDIVIRLLI
jgi:hypothetical protein